MPNYTVIDHTIQNKFEISLNEYAICNSIYILSRRKPCNASKQYLGKFIGIDRRTTHRILNKLVTKNLIKKVNKFEFETTDLWNDEIEKVEEAKISSETKCLSGCDKMSQSSETKCLSNCDKMSHNNNNISTINNNNDNIFKENKYYNAALEEIYKYWETSGLRKHKLSALKSNIAKKHLLVLSEYSKEQIFEAIQNYRTILLNPKEYFFYYEFNFWRFIEIKIINNFMSESNPLKNYRRNNIKEPEKTLEERLKNAGVI